MKESNKQKIEINTWKRKEHFLFFKEFEEQFHGVNVRLDMTDFFENAHKFNWHKSSAYFHKCMQAVNAVDAFRLRMDGEEVYLYDRIDFGMTVLKEDRTFAYSYTEFNQEYAVFEQSMKKAFEFTKNGNFLRQKSTNHVIHGSILPWIDFTGLTHARNFKRHDSAPKITFGKITRVHDKYFMPLSVHVNHALVDGIDLGDFINLYQNYLNEE